MSDAAGAAPPIAAVVARWHAVLAGTHPGGVASLLADDVAFHSPVVHAPQVGAAVTARYLEAAERVLVGVPPGAPPRFRYVREVLAGDTAVLEFETRLGDTHVNGVDIIRCDAAGRIVEFRVMVRPARALQAVHQAMGEALARHAAEAGGT